MTTAANTADGLFKTREEIRAQLDLFGAHSYALLVDDSTPQLVFEPDEDLECRGVYTFTLAAAGRTLLGHPIELLRTDDRPPACEAWLVATASKAVYPLLRYLYEHGAGSTLVFPLARKGITSMYAYVDFFKGETNSVVHLHNVFERTFKIHFPVAIRWLLRDLDGGVVRSSQEIIGPSCTVTIDSRTMDIPEPFAGYLEVFADVRHLNGEVTRFLHFNCDYVSDDGIATLHQSGLGAWPAGSRFVRGFLPPDPEIGLTVSVVNKTSDEPVDCAFTLNYTLNGEACETTRSIPPLERDHMMLVPVHDLFAAEFEAGARNADLVVIPDKPLHRPNNYLHPRMRHWSWTGVEHGAAPIHGPMTAEARAVWEELGIDPWICAFPLFDARFDIATKLVSLHEDTCGLNEFVIRAYDRGGTQLLERPERIDAGTNLDLHGYLSENGVAADGGLVTVAPDPAASSVPTGFTFMGAFEHRRHPYLSFFVVGGAPWNTDVEIERSAMWNHPMIPCAHTEQFGKGTVSDDFDTLIVLHNLGAARDYGVTANLELDLLASDGRMKRHYREIPPNSSIALSLAELLDEQPLPGPTFTVWTYCREAFVYGYHVLLRKSDHAISAEHFYYGRFNTPDPIESLLGQPLAPDSRGRVAVRHVPKPLKRAARKVVTSMH